MGQAIAWNRRARWAEIRKDRLGPPAAIGTGLLDPAPMAPEALPPGMPSLVWQLNLSH